jgi:sec-independent protein translocase protein TatA
MFSQFGPLEIILVIVVLLVIFGPKRLPSLGRQLGSGMREFKDSITGDGKGGRDDEDDRPALAQSKVDEPLSTPAEQTPVDAAPEQRG